MIASSRLAKIGALSLALAAHGAIALTLSKPDEARIEGSSGGAEVRLGSSFADMAAGRVAPEPADETTERVDPEPTDPEVTRERAETTDPAKTEPVTESDETARTKPARARPAQTRDISDKAPVPTAMSLSAGPADPPPVSKAAPAPPVKLLRPETGPRLETVRKEAQSPVTLSALAPVAATVPARKAPSATAPQPTARAKAAARPTPVKPANPAPKTTERLTGRAPDSAAVSRSLRPRMRTPEFEAANKPAAKPKPKVKPAAPSGGGAARNARAGSLSGNIGAKSRAKGTEGHKAASGNAAASNYPGLIMRKLSRARRPNVNARGAAVVSFSIAANGGLASVSLSGSSGSSALDRAAVRVVRNAAPFPPPPNGARRRFSIQIQGR